MDTTKNIIEQIARKRKEKRLSKLNFSKKSGVSRFTLMRFENHSEDIKFSNFIKMIDALDCKVLIIDKDI